MLKTTVEELNKEITKTNKTEQQMKTTIVTLEEMVDTLTKVITILLLYCSCVVVYILSCENILKVNFIGSPFL